MSSLPASSLPSGIPDFIPHFCEYALLAFFFIQVFAAPRRWPTLAVALLLLALLGLLDEWHQLSAPGTGFFTAGSALRHAGQRHGMAVFLAIARQKNRDPSNRDATRACG